MLKKKDPIFSDVSRLLIGYGLNGPRYGEILHKDAKTAKRKLDHPELLTLGDLRAACKSGGIPADRIREAIKFD